MKAAVRSLVLGGVLGVGVLGGGGYALAQSDTTIPTTTTTTAAGTTITPGSTVPGTAPAPTTTVKPGDPAPPDKGAGKDRAEGRGRRGRQGDDAPGGHGRGHGFGVTRQALADELGVTLDQLKEAGKAAHAAVQAQFGKPTRPEKHSGERTEDEKAKLKADFAARRALHDKTLADSLHITVERLTDARLAVVKKGLDAAVAKGRLTQARADEILARLRAGERPAFGPGGKGPHGRGGMSGKGHGPGGHGRGDKPADESADDAGEPGGS